MEILSAQAVIPITDDPIFQGAVVIDKNKILAVGSVDEVTQKFPGVSRRHFDSACLLPGLINAHTHLDLTAFPTDYFSTQEMGPSGMLRCKASFVDWISGVIQYRKTVVEQTLADAIQEGVERSLRSGTTCLGNISTVEGEFSILENAGIRAVLFPEIVSFDGEKAQDTFETIVGIFEKHSNQTTKGACENPILHFGISPHAPFTVSRPLLKIIEQYSQEANFKVQIHVAESFQEVEFFFDTGGEIADKLFPRVGWDQFRSPCVRKTPVEYLHDMGFMRCAPSMVHCVQVSDADIDRIVASQAQVVLCPRSNFYLGVGSAPWERFLEKNVILALGTDSLASNQSLSMWDEMRFLMEAAGDTLNPLQVLYMATMGSAKALGMEKEIGSLEEGKMADLVAIRLKENDLTQNSIFGHLVEHTFDPDIEMVMVGGNVCSGKKPAEISS